MLYREIIAVCSEIHTKHINTLCGQNVEFLGSCEAMRKATINFAVSVCPSAWNNSTSTGRIFMKFDIWVFFENLLSKFNFTKICQQ